jgi:charged multivesicular body protein 7
MKLYESSTATLRTILSHPSLQRDKIDETMDAMAEATADAEDIDNAIRAGGPICNDDELEGELKALIEEEQGAERGSETWERLTNDGMNTPTTIPNFEEEEQLEVAQMRPQAVGT